MKKGLFLISLAVCLSLVFVSCDTGMNDDTGVTGDTGDSDSATQDESMPGIDDILPSDTESSGATDGTQESAPPEGTTQPGMPDSGEGAGSTGGFGDTVKMVMEQIEEIISGTQKYLTNTSDKGLLTLAQARGAALADAHYSDDEVTFVKEELKKEDGREFYFLVFSCGGMKYYYGVDAYTAEIIYRNTEENS